MKKLVLAILLGVAPAAVQAAATGYPLMDAQVAPNDKASLQRGAKLFVDYCAGCHSAEYMRFNRVAQDLELPEDLVEQYLIQTGVKIGDTMVSAMDKDEAERWFGVVPPDLTLTARRRGADWVYTYLNTFYRDESKATGVNNLVFPDVGMPHVLWELQGMPQPVYQEVGHGQQAHLVVSDVKVPDGAGSMSQEQYRQATRDLTNFMDYMAEPIKAYRQSLGIKVLLFLAVFGFVAYLLKKEYWKDVH